MRIAVASRSDACAILSLQKVAYRSEASLYGDYSIPPLTQTLEQIASEFEDHLFLKAEASNEVLGSVRACLKDGTCFIGRLMVHPDHRGKGIGTTLMNSIEGRFRNTKRFELFTGSRSVRNISLYERLGYRLFSTKVISEDLTLVYLEKLRSG